MVHPVMLHEGEGLLVTSNLRYKEPVANANRSGL